MSDASTGIHGPRTPSQNLHPGERIISNVVGVISGVALGPIAAVGAAFLTVMVASGIGIVPLVGISLLVGAGVAVAAFFIFRKATAEIIKTTRQSTHQPTPANPQVRTAPTTPAVQPQILTQAAINSAAKHLKECNDGVASMLMGYEKALAQMNVVPHQNNAPGRLIHFTQYTMQQLSQSMQQLFANQRLTVQECQVQLQQLKQYYLSQIEGQIAQLQAIVNAAPSIEVGQDLGDYVQKRGADQAGLTFLHTLRLKVGHLFDQISFSGTFNQ